MAIYPVIDLHLATDEKYCVWPDGTVADPEDVWNGFYDHMSDDFIHGTLKRAVEMGYITEADRLEYEA